MSTKKTFVIAGVAAAASFLWGISVYRSQVFPYALVESVATKVGIVKERMPISPAAAPLAVLKSLPYVRASFDPDNELRGVVTFDQAKAQPGVNFYSVYKQDGAYLIDRHGDERAYRSTIRIRLELAKRHSPRKFEDPLGRSHRSSHSRSA